MNDNEVWRELDGEDGVYWRCRRSLESPGLVVMVRDDNTGLRIKCYIPHEQYEYTEDAARFILFATRNPRTWNCPIENEQKK